ncbi:DUF2163 domain-containing protein [Tropicibacter sp. Alg240-R139]|uniref:DUF2163 domain-containing protein n=1 Tax=Tropicibacter sp. Alg240-R139 TaxID=2305991 RepID=UPI0013E0773D|nr:DUF2163 domain-containing protein [Tropicibacter sp. Alg240-R139]
MDERFKSHLRTGMTTLARCWAIRRSDGREYGFTDHDRSLSFDGLEFKADTGLTALAVEQSTGLSVDNTEALGAISDLSVRAEDIEAGRFDGAEVTAWLVNWADTDMRWMQFRGTIGELRRTGNAFQAELRGLTEALNQPTGRIFQKPCTAVLGDGACRFDTNEPGYAVELEVEAFEDGLVLRWKELPGFEPGWFERGRLNVLSGSANGLWGLIKRDLNDGDMRAIHLWEPMRGGLQVGDTVKLLAGCDKRLETCRLKFNNVLNFQGFPDIPSEDWVLAVPKQTGQNTGGSLR